MVKREKIVLVIAVLGIVGIVLGFGGFGERWRTEKEDINDIVRNYGDYSAYGV